MSADGDDEPHVALANFVATVARDVDVLLSSRDVLLEPLTGEVDVFGPLAEAWAAYRTEQTEALLAAVVDLPFGRLAGAGLTGPGLYARLTVCGHARDGASVAWSIALGEHRTRRVEAFTPDLHDTRVRARLLKKLLTWLSYYLHQVDAILDSLAPLLPGLEPLRQTKALLDHGCELASTLLAS